MKPNFHSFFYVQLFPSTLIKVPPPLTKTDHLMLLKETSI